MKKIMILMLSLAVLFSFAACDNSNNGPADDTETPSTGISDLTIETVGTDISGLLTGSEGLLAKIGSANILEQKNGAWVEKANFEVSDDYKTITYTIPAVAGSTDLQGPTNVKFTITGEDITKVADTASKRDILLTRYTMEYSKSDANMEGNYVEVKGTVSGALVGTVTVTIDAKGANSVVPAITDAILPDTANVTYDGASVDGEKLMKTIGKVSGADAKWQTATEFKTAKENVAKKDMNSYVEAIFAGVTPSTLLENINQFLNQTDVTKKYADGNADTKAYAEISYTVPSGKYMVASADKSVVIKNLTIKIEAAAAALTTGTFDPATFELSGTFDVFSEKTGTTAEADFTTITLDKVTGTAAKTSTAISGSNNEIVSLGDVAFTFDDQDATGTVKANVLTEVGPAVSNGKLAALGDVTLDYAKDAAALV